MTVQERIEQTLYTCGIVATSITEITPDFFSVSTANDSFNVEVPKRGPIRVPKSVIDAADRSLVSNLIKKLVN